MSKGGTGYSLQTSSAQYPPDRWLLTVVEGVGVAAIAAVTLLGVWLALPLAPTVHPASSGLLQQ